MDTEAAIVERILEIFSGIITILAFGFLLLTGVIGIIACFDPRTFTCMQVVKGEMRYSELKKRIKEETFEEPLTFKSKWNNRLLVSQNWVLLWTDSEPVCIPQNKITDIVVETDEVGYLIDEAKNEWKVERNYYMLKIICGEQSFLIGSIEPDNLEDAIEALKKHLPGFEYKII
ncbi:MAG: hypothetical protein IKZ87_00640 [Actinomycetaceae bacterium]|nr:hypothetical protein [Actinomycetaceae bacterium]